jgi:hypothetical protein
LIRTAFGCNHQPALPTDLKQQSEVYGTADAVKDVTGFCDRNLTLAKGLTSSAFVRRPNSAEMLTSLRTRTSPPQRD